jgi:hypothetical protein
MSYRNVQKFYITKTLVNISKMKIGRKSLAKASLILFLTCFIIFLILLKPNLVKGVSGSSITKYLGTTPIANLGGTYWNLTDTTGAANTATSVRNARLTGKFIFRPGTANSQLTGNPDSGVPAGFGWGTNYTLKGTIPAGTWTFQVKTTSTSATGQGFVGVVVYKNCTGTSTRLFGVFNTTRNVLSSTAATITTITTNQPAFDVDGCYLKVEYWLNVTAAGGSNTGTVTFTVNELSEFIQFPVDTTPPQWSNQSQSTSAPAVGDQVNLSAYWTDDTALSHAWLATNETGIWENKTTYGSPISFAAAVNGWSNFTWQNSSITAGTVVAWRIYANDTSGNENVTDIMTFKVSDTQPPTYSLNSTNSTTAGSAISHNLYWQDDVGLSHAIFSFDNCTGSMQNISVMSLSGIASWSNFTVVINSTVGCTIRWCVYANDTSNNWNGTSCENPFSYTTTPANQPPALSNRIEVPSSPTTYSPGATYTFNITVNDPNGESDISTVIFEFNGINETVTSYVVHNSTARNYSIAKIDLAANPSGYIFRWYANDSQNAWGNVVEGIYVINKAASSISITFSSNPATYPTETTATCNKIAGDNSAILTLFRNNTQVAQSSGSSISETITLGAGVWNYSCTYSESENYTSSSLIDQNLQVNKGNNILTSLICYPSSTVTYPTQTTCTGSQTSTGDNDVIYYLYRNETLVSQLTNSNPSETILLGAGIYIYKFNSSEGANYTANSTGITLTLIVQQNTSTINFMNLTINGTESNKIYTYPAVSNVTGWFDVNAFVGPAPTFTLYRNTTEIGNSNPISDIVQLAAGFYNYTYYTAGNQNYSSATKQLNLTIQKADILPYLHISINGTESDSIYTYENITNVTAWSTLTGQAGITYNLYRNTSTTSILIGTGTSVSDILRLGADTYYYVYNTTGNENYTSGSLTRILTINKKTPINMLDVYPALTNTYPTQTTVTCSIISLNNEVTAQLYRNSSAINPLPSTTETIILGGGAHTYTCNNTATQNYTSSSNSSIIIIHKNTSTANFMNLTIGIGITGQENNFTTTYPTTTNATGWYDSSVFAGQTIVFTLYRNSTPIGNSNPISDIIMLGSGTYNYTYYTEGNENYTSATKNYWLFVNKGDPSPFINLFIDNQTSDKAIVYPAIAEIRGNVSAIQGANDLIFNFYRNNLLIGSGNSTNQTVDTTRLGNATYTFLYNTTGGANWTSGSSPTRKLYVLKGIVPLRLAINGTEASQTFTYENITNVTGWSEVTGEDLTFNLYRDGVQIASGSPASEIIRLGAGTYTYVFNTSGGSNYTSNSTSLTLTINPKNINIYLALNGTQANRTYTYPEAVNATAWKDSTINNEGTVTLLRDGISIGSGQIVTEEILLGNGTYNYSATFSAFNYTANPILSNRFALVNKGMPPIYLAINGTQGNVTYTYPTPSNATGWLETLNDEGTVTLLRDGIIIGSGISVSEIILLGSGEYNYSLVFAETQNYSYNSITKDRFLKINRATSSAILILTPESPITYETKTNATCLETNPEADGKLFRNNTDVTSENNTLITLPAGIWEYVCNVTETQNYTSASASAIYIVNKKNANVQVYPLTQTLTYPVTVLQYCTDDSLFMDCSLYRNETLISNNTEYSPAAGVYVYKANITDTANYTNYEDVEILTVNKAASSVRLFLNGTEGNRSYTYEDYANITATLNISGKVFYVEANFTGATQIINQGISPLVNITKDFGAGLFNVTAYWSGDENYTGDSKTYFMTVNKKPTTTFLWINGTRGDKFYTNGSFVNFTVELVGYPGRQVELWTNYTDGQWKKWDSGNSPLQNITQLNSLGIFNFTGNFSGNANYTESYESWVVSVSLLQLTAKLESLSPASISQRENSTAIGNCSCIGGTCNNVYMEIQADEIPIPNSTGSNLQVNGSNPYFIGSLIDSWAIRAWNITGWEAGVYSIRIKCNSTETMDVFSSTKDLQVNDTTSPTWSSNLTSPISPTIYSPGKTYQFNITWNDNVGISTVFIEHNFTGGTLINSTMSNLSSEYYFTISDLKAGTYVWRSYANDTSNNWNVTDQFVYVVYKAPTLTRLFLNGTEGNRTYNVTEFANFTVALNVSGKTVYLETNMSDWILQSGITPLINYTKLNQKGVFNITGYFLGDENYTASSQTYYANVLDIESPKWNNLGQNATWVGVNKTILLFANWTDNFDLDYAWLSTNETGEWKNYTAIDINLTYNQTWSNFTWQNSSIPAGWTIAFRIYANDSSGNENATEIRTFVVNASEVWRFLTSGFIYSSPAVGDINDDNIIDVVFGSYDKGIYALRGSDGAKIWNFTTNGSVASSPSLANLTGSFYLDVFVGSYDFNMYAINGSDGSKIWNFSTGGIIFSSPAIYDVNKDGFLDIVFGSADNKIYALNGSNGNLLWSYTTNGRIFSSPAIRNISVNSYPVVFVGSYDFNMYAINGSDGSKIWNFSAQDKIESSPAVDDINDDGFLEVVFGSYDGRIYVLNASNGEQVWNYTTGNWITSSPVIANISNSKKIIVGSHDSKVYAFNSDGTINWTFTIPTGGRIPSSPSIADVNLDGINDVIVGATDGRIYAISGNNGNLIWSYNIGQYIFSSPSLADLNGDGNLDITFGSLNKNQYLLDPPSWNLFGANERRTRIFDNSPPELLLSGIEKNGSKVIVYSLWKEKFSNLDYAIIKENSTGTWNLHTIKLKGTKDWVNYSFYYSSFSYIIEVFDEYGNSHKIENHVESEYRDNNAPLWYNNQPYLQFNYSRNQIYQLNVSWYDESDIEIVTIEHNFTGEFVNETVSNFDGNNYHFSVKDLPAGTYSWKEYAKDIYGNWNSTDSFFLIVNKIQPSLEIVLPENVTYPSLVNVSCIKIEGDLNSSLILLRNDVEIDRGEIVSEISTLNAGFWNYSCIYSETQNYSYFKLSKNLKVEKGIPNLTLSINYNNTCPSNANILAYENNTGDEDVVYRLYNDYQLLNEGSEIQLNYTFLAGEYNFVYNSTEGENWTSNHVTNFINIFDNSNPVNEVFGKKFENRESLLIYSKWNDGCSNLTYALIKENSTGTWKEHEIRMNGMVDWANYTIPENDLKSENGCRWILNFICFKRIFFSVEAFDSYNNSIELSDSVSYIFIKPFKLNFNWFRLG